MFRTVIVCDCCKKEIKYKEPYNTIDLQSYYYDDSKRKYIELCDGLRKPASELCETCFDKVLEYLIQLETEKKEGKSN